MYLSEDDAATVYARACQSWYGKRASRIVKDQIAHRKGLVTRKGRASVVPRLRRPSRIKRPRKASEDGKLY